jgi:hypothetical protein
MGYRQNLRVFSTIFTGHHTRPHLLVYTPCIYNSLTAPRVDRQTQFSLFLHGGSTPPLIPPSTDEQ